MNPSSLAAGVGVSVFNTNFAVPGTDLPRKIAVIGLVDPTLESGLTENVAEIVVNPAHAAVRYGRGFGLAKLIEWLSDVFTGEIWAVPQFENTPTQSTGNILFDGTCTKAGMLHLYVGGHKVQNINIAVGDGGENMQEKVVAAIALNPDLPVTAAENGSTPEQADFTAKSGCADWDFDLGFNYGFNEEYPEGITTPVVTAMSGGAGLGVMADALNGMGLADNQNLNGYTAIVHMNGQDTTSLDALSNWNGIGNEISGNYSKSVSRPVRSLVGDTVAGSSGLSALLTLGGNRKEADRTSGCVPVPGSPNHPCEIAAKVVGIMEEISSVRPEENYVGRIIPGIIPGDVDDNWCADYDDCDTAIKTGIGFTDIKGSSVVLGNVISFYHSDAIPVASNGYREMRNIAIIQNFLYYVRTNFQSENWKGTSIVADKAKVTNVTNRQKARSLSDVIDDLISLVTVFESKAWVWSAQWTIDKLKEGGYVAIRDASNGFDVVLPLLLSIINNVDDIQIQFDANVAIAL